jgi:hypothetical protein
MKKIDNYSIFEYNPLGKRLLLSTNETLIYNFKSKEFNINQNPKGESKLEPIFDITVQDSFNSLSFSTIYRKKIKLIIMTSRNIVDNLIYKFFSDIRENEFDVHDNDLDHIIFVVKNNLIDEITCYKKNKDYELLDSLTIKNENDSLFMEKYEPSFSKNKIADVSIEQNKFLIKLEDGCVRRYVIDAQNRIIEFLKTILERRA